MKLLHVVSSMDPGNGGVAEYIYQIVPELEKLGVESIVICMDKEDAPWLTNNNITISSVGLGKGAFSYSEKLKLWLRDNVVHFDAVIIHGLWQYHTLAARAVCKELSVDYYVFTHGMLDPWFNRNYFLKYVKKFIYWHLFENKVINDAKAVLFTCEEEKLLARQSFKRYNPNEKVVAFGTAGVTIQRESSIEVFFDKHARLINKKIILFVGRIHEKKGCDLLLKTFHRLKDSELNGFHLFFAGPDDSEYANALKNYTRDNNLEEDVTWGGMITGAEKWGAFYAAEIFCLPSHQENFGIVVAEALSCGLPVLISNKVNIWREIVRDKAGLAAEDNLAGTENNFKKWINSTDTDKNKFKENALLCFSDNFEISKSAQSLLDVIA